MSFAEASYAVAEGGRVTVTVQLSANPERTVEIPLTATAQGATTAPGGTDPDYLAPPASVTFATGQTERTFTFSATQDPDDDDGESVLLGFGMLPARVNAGATATVNITDDDEPRVNVTPQTLRVVQGRSTTYRVTLNTRPTGNVTVTPASDNPDVTFQPTKPDLHACGMEQRAERHGQRARRFRRPIGHDHPHRQRLPGSHHGPRRERDGHGGATATTATATTTTTAVNIRKQRGKHSEPSA